MSCLASNRPASGHADPLPPEQAGGSKLGRPSNDHLTILRTEAPNTASKRFVKTASGVVLHNYSAGLYFRVLPPQPVTDIFVLSEVLTALEDIPQCLVIRGAPADATYIGKLVRRKGSCGVGNFFTPTEGRRWVLIDLDKIGLPQHLSLTTDAISVCEHLVGLLPAEFHDATYHWQLSSSAGMGDPTKVSVHLWFFLSRPVPDSDLKIWAKHVNESAGYKLVDHMLFQHVQAHYTAAPTFEGVANPFPVRSGLKRKNNDSVDLVLPVTATAQARSAAATKPTVVRAIDETGFAYHLSRIGDHAGGDGFHEPITTAAASYVGKHGAEGTDIEVVYEQVRAMVLAADAAHHDAAYIAHMASREHIIPAIESAMRKFGQQAAGRKTAAHAGAKPHYQTERMSVADAQRLLDKIAQRGA
jgi:hypothetical protein